MAESKKPANKPTGRAKPAASRKPKAKVATEETGTKRSAAAAASQPAVSGDSAFKPKSQNRFSAARKPKTYMVRPQDIVREWHLVDLDGLVLGRAASRIAHILRGKHKPMYTPHADAGDYVVVVNAEKVKLTGSKEDKKPYYRHSLHPGGLKTTLARDMRARNPERLIEAAVRRMIPRNPLGRDVLSKLKIYVGPAHPHQAQQPKPLKLDL
jgi:large subunit ribosomal protein L13